MNSKGKPAELPMGDLIDRIAKALPPDVRADYYRELMHCRSLPDNDEMLRILRILQFLTLLMEQVPHRVVLERQRLEELFTAALQALQKPLQSSEAYQRQLDERLAQLPDEIAAGISPSAIAANINEVLRQQFVRSTIPETARALALIAEQMKNATADFGTAASTFGNSYRGAAEEAQRSINSMESAIFSAARTAKRAAEELSLSFHRAYWWSIYGLTGVALVIGFLLGMLCTR